MHQFPKCSAHVAFDSSVDEGSGTWLLGYGESHFIVTSECCAKSLFKVYFCVLPCLGHDLRSETMASTILIRDRPRDPIIYAKREY